MFTQKMRDQVLIQLSQYRYSKTILKEYGKIALPARSDAPRVSGGGHGDPTARQAFLQIEPPPGIKELQGWVRAIESAYHYLREEKPEHACMMQLLYGVCNEDNVPLRSRSRRQLIDILCVCESTMYRWRGQILQTVMVAAVEEGVLGAFREKNVEAYRAKND